MSFFFETELLARSTAHICAHLWPCKYNGYSIRIYLLAHVFEHEKIMQAYGCCEFCYVGGSFRTQYVELYSVSCYEAYELWMRRYWLAITLALAKTTLNCVVRTDVVRFVHQSRRLSFFYFTFSLFLFIYFFCFLFSSLIFILFRRSAVSILCASIWFAKIFRTNEMKVCNRFQNWKLISKNESVRTRKKTIERNKTFS